MSIISSLNERERQRRRGYRHNSNQPGWIDSSYKPARTLEEAQYLGDEEYNHRLGVHNPLWRYVIRRYTKESDAPLLVMGYDTLSIAIELSQWTYPVIYVSETEKEVSDVKRDAQRQAGFFKELLKIPYKAYRGYFPASRVAIFIGIIDEMSPDDAKIFVDNLLKSVNEIVCAVAPNRDWRSALAKYRLDGLSYYKDQWILLRIERK